MAELVVHFLEFIDVDDEDSEVGAGIGFVADGGFECHVEGGAVWKAGQGVAIGQSADLGFLA